MSRPVHFAEEVVISGISGAYPSSENVQEFKENLYSRKHLITPAKETRKDGCYSKEAYGSLKNIERFDNLFFCIINKHADEMDPVARIIMEKVFEAIVDAGYNPIEFKGTNTGVFIGSCLGDLIRARAETEELSGISRFKALYANRISYWLDINGPSYVVDSACSSSLTVLENGYRAIQDGICDFAIVAGVNLCIDDGLTEAYQKNQVHSPEAACKTFDEEANGFIRAEAAVALLLQKRNDARRVYANLLHVKINCDGFKSEGITYPDVEGHKKLYQSFYREINIDPRSVDYIEAHGTGTKIGDVVEVQAIDSVFCEGRSKPLKIGSVKSNMGHSEGAAAVCAVTKVVIAYEHGLIPPNINLKKLNPKIPAFYNGRIEVVTEPIPCEKYLIGINGFGIGGANGHALLSPNVKEKQLLHHPVTDVPHLVFVSGRTDEAVDVLLNGLEKHQQDTEYIALFHKIFAKDINGHLYRGYTVLKNEEESFKHKMVSDAIVYEYIFDIG